MMKYPFADSPNTACITCCHVLDEGLPILYVSHDEDDGMWQFLCGQSHEINEAKIISLMSILEIDPTVSLLKDMPRGYYAVRENVLEYWEIHKNNS